MDRIEAIKHIAYLISRHRKSELTDQEAADLANWLEQSPKNRQLLDELTDEQSIRTHLTYLYQKHVNTDEAWNRVEQKLEITHKPKEKHVSYRLLPWAAAFIAIAGGAWLFHVYRQTPLSPAIPPAVVAASSEKNLPGGNKGLLILSDGQQVQLGNDSVSLTDQAGAIITAREGGLVYHPEDASQNERLAYNTLVVPKTGTYHLILPDGTKVWLNALSTLKFPVKFSADERRVFLAGEAFFEVAHNPAHPFVVTVNDRYEVKALGTAFNISSYQSYFKTILAEGSLQVSVDGDSKLLKPAEQVIWQNGVLAHAAADIEEATAWRDGYFYFNGKPITAVMDDVARWYDTDIQWSDDNIPTNRYSGSVSRYVKLEEVLRILHKASGLQFKLDGQTIVISK